MKPAVRITACAFLVSTFNCSFAADSECWREAGGYPVDVTIHRGSQVPLYGESFASIVRQVDHTDSSDGEDTALRLVMSELSMRDAGEAKPLLAMLLSVADRLPAEIARVHFEAQ